MSCAYYQPERELLAMWRESTMIATVLVATFKSVSVRLWIELNNSISS